MTKTNKKSKLLALLGLIMAGITALTCAILATPRNTFASNSGITSDNFPDTSTYIEKDVNEGDTLAGKFLRVTVQDLSGEGVGRIYVGAQGEVCLQIIPGFSASFCDVGNALNPIEQMICGNKGENTLDIYVQKDKTLTLTSGNVSTNDLVFNSSSIFNCTVKELVVPVAEDEDTRNEVEKWLDNAGNVISDWLNENLGVSIGGSVALVLVVAIIVAILKRKK